MKQSMTLFIQTQAEIIIYESDTDDIFESIYTTIISNIQKSLGKGSGLLIQSLIIILVIQNIILTYLESVSLITTPPPIYEYFIKSHPPPHFTHFITDPPPPTLYGKINNFFALNIIF